MIIFRYFAKEIISITLAVLLVLLIVFVSTQLAIFLDDMANGLLTTHIFLQLAVTMIPTLAALLIPLAFFVALLLAYSRLYAETEMTAFYACGMTRVRLLTYTLIMAVVVTALVGFLELSLSPRLARHQTALLQDSIGNDLFGTILPGHFQELSADRIMYVETVSRDRTRLNNLFIAGHSSSSNPIQDNSQPTPSNNNSWDIIVGQTGQKLHQPDKGGDYLVMTQGKRFVGTPGEKNFLIISYDTYGVRLPTAVIGKLKSQITGAPTPELIKNYYHDRHAAAELQWRLSIIIQTLILALLAVPLSRTQPREGRYAPLLPALLIYIFYANFLFMAREWVDEGKVSIQIGVWWLHAALLALTLYLYAGKPGWSVKQKFAHYWRRGPI